VLSKLASKVTGHHFQYSPVFSILVVFCLWLDPRERFLALRLVRVATALYFSRDSEAATRRFFDDSDSVMPRIGGRRGPIRCRKPLKMRTDLS
jgi:hypothetical protein